MLETHAYSLVAFVVLAGLGLIAAYGWHSCAREVQRLRRDRLEWMTRAEEHAAARRDLLRDVVLFQRALGFYARDTHWRPMRTRRHSITFRDRGAVARAALRGEDVDQIMQQLQLAQAEPVKAPDTSAAGPDTAAATSAPEHAQAA